MATLLISGSAKSDSTNQKLLDYLVGTLPAGSTRKFDLARIPLFVDGRPAAASVRAWQSEVAAAAAVIISTPEYIHGVPAALKSALEWLTRGGELRSKPVLAITLTPHPPRGAKAMSALLHSLEALDARVVARAC